jgi:hypothetical protein
MDGFNLLSWGRRLYWAKSGFVNGFLSEVFQVSFGFRVFSGFFRVSGFFGFWAFQVSGAPTGEKMKLTPKPGSARVGFGFGSRV